MSDQKTIHPLLRRRCSGVLLHLTSLPGPGIGDLGDAAYRWVRWLRDAEQAVWQVLPLVPVGQGGSPYNGLSAFAGNPLLVDPERLVRAGLLGPDEIRAPSFPADRIDFAGVHEWKEQLLRSAFAVFQNGRAPALREPFEEFQTRSAGWLDDYALFIALRERHGGEPWTSWEEPIRLRQARALERARATLAEELQRIAFAQFLFERQWTELRHYARARGIRVMGDIPIFVALDSADVWANPAVFKLDEAGQPTVVSGVPPDYFSETGQRWGNPLYRWDVMRDRGFLWWAERFRRTFELVDLVRIDHFRGFQAAWEIPAEEETALRGNWVPGPGTELFRAVERRLGPLPLVAEDLGLITPAVEALRDALGLPGMRVLQFAFDGDPANPHLPDNHPPLSVVYTGTHDNDTTLGWFADVGEDERTAVLERLPPGDEPISWKLIRMVWDSPARIAVAPLQDVLGLGSEARMNTPGTAEGNWGWRLSEGQLSRHSAERLATLTRAAGRANFFPNAEPFS